MAAKKRTERILGYIAKLLEKSKPALKYCLKFLFVVVIYGLIVAFVFAQLFGYAFSIKNIIAFGFAFYIIKSELPSVISSCLPRPPPMIPLH